MIQTLGFDAAAATTVGKRASQEDCYAVDFSNEAKAGLAVLSDGMGGYSGGMAAAKFLVTGVAGELQAELENFNKTELQLARKLNELTHFANDRLGDFIQNRGNGQKMGATLLTVAVSRNRLFWASVGDSALYVYRDGVLTRLNEDHSMSAEIDFMVKMGMMSEEKGRDHPNRSILTSAIHGKEITKIDNPTRPYILEMDDIILLASDGLSTLSKGKVEDVMAHSMYGESIDMTQEILTAISDQRSADQDNATLIVIRVVPASEAAELSSDQAMMQVG